MGGRQARAAVPRRRSSSRRACRPTPRRARPSSRCSRTRRRSSSALDRRGVPRRPRLRAARRHAGRDRGAAAARRARAGRPADHRRRREDEVPRQGRERRRQARRPARRRARAASSRSSTRCPVERLWGVGPVTAAKLHDGGRDGRRGRGARRGGARRAARPGGRPAPARARRQPRPAGRAHRAPPALDRLAARARGAVRGRAAEIDASLVGLVDRVTRRMRAAGRVGRTVVLRLRFGDFTRATRSHTMPPLDGPDPDDPRRGARAARHRHADDRAQGPDADRRGGDEPGGRRAASARAAVRARPARRSTTRSTRCGAGSDRRR